MWVLSHLGEMSVGSLVNVFGKEIVETSKGEGYESRGE